MIRFECDYAEGAHPRIIENLVKTNFEQTAGYCTDEYSAKARECIKKAIACDTADVHLFVGGTPCNKTVIASILRPHQGVIAADTGHIATHESGTIEASGHKVLTLPNINGKITAEQIKARIENHLNDDTKEHDVQPGMVYISNPTESGTLYSKQELMDISAVCNNYGLPLYCDGARMGYGLASPENDLTLEDYAKYCDAFYIGITKVGALFGEAVVIVKDELKKDFRYFIKQNASLFAKGRLLGIQFVTLFEDGLYMQISQNAIDCAMKIKAALTDLGIEFTFNSPTNQQFVIFPKAVFDELSKKYSFAVLERHPDVIIARICTSWATKMENVDELIADFRSLVK